MNLSSSRAQLASLFFLAVAATACGTSPTEPSAVVFEDVTWKLESWAYADGTSLTIDDPNAFTAHFAGDERFHAQADCNVCNGSYGAEDGSISIGLLACTRAFCFSAPLDTDYTAALQAATTLSISNEKLLLHSAGDTLTFRR